jgi:SAM-dependent methyltransferase
VYGCGTDAAPSWFAARGAVVDAIDISPISVDLQKIVAARLDLRVNAVVADAHQTGLPAEDYDLVYGNAICIIWICLEQPRRSGGSSSLMVWLCSGM